MKKSLFSTQISEKGHIWSKQSLFNNFFCINFYNIIFTILLSTKIRFDRYKIFDQFPLNTFHYYFMSLVFFKTYVLENPNYWLHEELDDVDMFALCSDGYLHIATFEKFIVFAAKKNSTNVWSSFSLFCRHQLFISCNVAFEPYGSNCSAGTCIWTFYVESYLYKRTVWGWSRYCRASETRRIYGLF